MIPFKYYLVSLSPDPIRNEIVNIGVVGFCEGAVSTRFLTTFEKVKAISPSFEAPISLGDQYRNMLMKIPENSREDFLLNMGNAGIHFSEAARGTAKNAEDFEVCINQLFDQLVKPLPKVRPTAQSDGSRLKTQIKQQLLKSKLIGTDINQHQVVPNFQVGQAGRLVADFAYKNGKLNIIEAVDLRVANLGSKFKDAALAAVIVDSARKKIDAKAFGRAIYFPHPDGHEATAPHLSIMNDYFDATYNFSDKDERGKFYLDVERDLTGNLLS